MGSVGGQASGDFRLSQGALRVLYAVIKGDSAPVLAADGFVQNNPNVVTTATSDTIPANVKKGVLGGSVAFIRPDIGENTVGGAVLTGGAAYIERTRPLGLFLNDAVGNANENTPGPASGKGPFLRGGLAGVKLYETYIQTTTGGGVVGNPVAYNVGDRLYASVNGYLTTRWEDSYEAQWITAAGVGSGAAGAALEPDVTRMGIVLAPPSPGSAELYLEAAFI